MEFYLQFAHGMLDISRSLVRTWQGGTVILSPRDLEPDQIETNAPELRRRGARLLFDPQCYARRADHPRLTQYSYWVNDYSTASFGPDAVRSQLSDLYENHNVRYGTEAFIVPGQYISAVDDIFFAASDLVLNELSKIPVDRPRFLTICLAAAVLRDDTQLHNLLEYLEGLPVEGIYLVAEPVGEKYLVDDPVWLRNLLEACAVIKLDGKKLIVGYGNHQYLMLALAKVDAIASGNFLNARSYSNEKFFQHEDSPSRRAIWYYCPQSLSEYKIPFLDLAHTAGVLEHLKADPSLGSSYADILFSGAQPSSVEFREPNPFYHYLQCLRAQVSQLDSGDYDSAKRAVTLRLEAASELTEFFRQRGIRGGDRDFSNVVDPMLAGVTAFDSLWGLRMRTRWHAI